MPRPIGIGRTFNMGFILMTDGGDCLAEEALSDPSTAGAVRALVQALHEAGYVHGDIHAGSVVKREGRYLLVDLGRV